MDVPLNDTGRQQATQLIAPLKRVGVQTILSSDLSRARETAQIIASALEISVSIDAGLREAHLGDAQGLTVQEIEAKFGSELVSRWRSPFLSDADVSYPGGETGRQVLERVLRAMEDFLESSTEDCIGVATHGGVIRRLARHLLGENAAPVPIPNGILYPLSFDRKNKTWKLEKLTPLKLSGF